MLRVEKKFWNWFLKNPALLIVAAGTVLSLLVRYWAKEFQSEDMEIFFRWLGKVQENGGIHSLGVKIGDYGMLFHFMLVIASWLPLPPVIAIKAVLLPFDFIQAIAIALIVKHITGNKLISAIAYAAALLFPVTVMNSAYWGQCASFFTGFGLLCVYFLLKEKPVPAFLFMGLAFTIKLQAIFFFPFLLFYYVYKKNYSLLHFLLIPAVILVSALPCILAGRSPLEAFRLLFSQSGQYEMLSCNYPSFWGLMFPNYEKAFYGELQGWAIVSTLMVLAVGMVLLLRLKKPLTETDLMKVLALTLYVCPLMLPNMHERYDYTAILACLLVACLDRKTLPLLLVFMLINMRTYGDFLFGFHLGYTVNWVALSIANIACFTLYAWNFVTDIRRREACP